MTAADATRVTGTVLDRIVADRRERLPAERRAAPESALAELVARAAPPIDFAQRLRAGRRAAPAGAALRLVAEVKRASPSRGVFNAELDAGAQASAYAEAGASAVSVLTEPAFFHGSIEDLDAAGRAFGADEDRPALLRKDFIFDRYQVIEARAHGADAVLLIVAMLAPEALAGLAALVREHGMTPLIEAHDEGELEAAVRAGPGVLGVNNRNLRTFEEDLGTTERLASLAPSGMVVLAESGIRTAADARRMAAAGAHAVLVGEALVTGDDVGAKARELMLVAGPGARDS